MFFCIVFKLHVTFHHLSQFSMHYWPYLLHRQYCLNNHFNHVSFTSGNPPVFVEITAAVAAIASKAAKPKLSVSEGNKNTSV